MPQHSDELRLPHVTSEQALVLRASYISSHGLSTIPSIQGTKAIYTFVTQTHDSHAITETRFIDVLAWTSTPYSNNPRDREAKRLVKGNFVLWLKDVGFEATECWIVNAKDAGQSQRQ